MCISLCHYKVKFRSKLFYKSYLDANIFIEVVTHVYIIKSKTCRPYYNIQTITPCSTKTLYLAIISCDSGYLETVKRRSKTPTPVQLSYSSLELEVPGIFPGP